MPICVVSESALDESRAKPAPARRGYRGSATLLPPETKPWSRRMGFQRPGYVNVTVSGRQRAVFCCVGGKFLKCHGERESALGLQANVRPPDRESATALTAIGLHCSLDDFA